MSAVPYLVHLCSVCPDLCRGLLDGLVDLLSPALLARVQALVPAWSQQYFRGPETSLLDLVTQILVSTDRSASRTIRGKILSVGLVE